MPCLDNVILREEIFWRRLIPKVVLYWYYEKMGWRVNLRPILRRTDDERSSGAVCNGLSTRHIGDTRCFSVLSVNDVEYRHA